MTDLDQTWTSLTPQGKSYFINSFLQEKSFKVENIFLSFFTLIFDKNN